MATHSSILPSNYVFKNQVVSASLMAQTVKKSICQHKRPRFDPWVGKIPGEGNGNPLQYSCLEISMDRGAWWATVHGVAESDMTEQLTLSLSVP